MSDVAMVTDVNMSRGMSDVAIVTCVNISRGMSDVAMVTCVSCKCTTAGDQQIPSMFDKNTDLAQN